MKRISLTEVEISESAIRRVEDVLRSGRIGQGKVIEEFEDRFASWVGSKYAIAVSSGTMADTIALAVLKNIYPEKKKVAIPALTFAAHLNSIIYNGLTPVFYDEGGSFEMEGVLCAFPVHLLGKPTKLNKPRGLMVIEDACEAMGSVIFDRKCGTGVEMGTFSFFPSHTMTTGEGGMIVTNRIEYRDLARTLRNHGKDTSSDFHFSYVGFNGKMTSMQAALGISALQNVDKDIETRRNNFLWLGGEEEIGEYISPHALPFICSSREARALFMLKLNTLGVECRNLFSSLPTQEKAYEYFGHKLGEFPKAEKVGDCGLYVPCHQYLTRNELELIKELLCEEEKTQETEVLTK